VPGATAAVKVGITLPQFRDDADAALDAARRAEALGFDGVFCFDHLWPMNRPGRPVLSSGPLLGAVAASTSTTAVGCLVARVGMVPDQVLVAVMSSLWAISDGRLIAGIGTGDHLSRPENLAFGIPFEAAEQRRARLVVVATAVGAMGIPVWIGGGHPRTDELARPVGATVNLWAGEVSRVAELTAAGTEVSWAGPIGATVPEASARLAGLAAAGATWAVCAWPDSLEATAEAARAARALT
jgi:alkanesulfonate monooxygenase SsuD/methylene tetrahydromethanopterin reductase-like flavin-dependent oxidoreductase (luciferase family)